MRRTPAAWVILVAVAALGLGSQAFGFHDGGVAECSGCHSMHDASSNSYLLQGSDPSSTCLNCHEADSQRSYRISTALSYMTGNPTDGPLQKGPAGDFAWVRMDRTATASYGSPLSFDGEDNGHNIVALDNDYVADSTAQAPGGSMPSIQLNCVSCHDMHGQGRITGTGALPVIDIPTIGDTHDPIFSSGSYGDEPVAGEAVGTYRLLPGDYYNAWSIIKFPGVPAAVAPDDYNRAEDTAMTRVAYGYSATDASGFTSWGRWCATCHPGMHTDTAGFKHEVDSQIFSDQVDFYNNYVKTGDLTGLFAPRAGVYTSLVTFAENTKSIPALALNAVSDDSKPLGPTSQDRMSCLTCHRAHASAWKWGLRWNGDAEFLTLGAAGAPVYPGIDAGLGNQGQFNAGYTVEQMTDGYYGRPADCEFAAHQRSLCNKCHAKD